MKGADFNSRLIDGYIDLLKNLNSASKRDLISRLSKSVKNDLKHSKTSFEKAFGAFDSPGSADELANKIRAARTFNRQIEQFWISS